MLLNSRPVRFLITRVARAYGYLDPITLLGKLRGFSQPSEFAEPIELLRAGMLFHARGLVNTKAIQNNLDWVWPYWVERQFDPNDDSFIPRAFSFSHINLTHRNWTAVGLPDVPFYPIVDPRGLITPLYDGWSLDFWVLPDHPVKPAGISGASEPLFPSQGAEVEQRLHCDERLHVTTQARRAADDARVSTDVWLELRDGEPTALIDVVAAGPARGVLVVALRPYNPEGISSIDTIRLGEGGREWLVNKRQRVTFGEKPAKTLLSIYRDGDVSHRLAADGSADAVTCPVGMATAAAFFPFRSDGQMAVRLEVPVRDELHQSKRLSLGAATRWRTALAPLAKLAIADPGWVRLYDHAVANMVLHAPGEVYPGPYTYKRFWFRDAAFVLQALIGIGEVDRVRRALSEFAPRQRRDGYFLSQEGEWDSNGEAIWMYHRFASLTGETLPEAWLAAVEHGARWISRKRLPRDTGLPQAGLLPAGFSAEHLGPNDFYYWDDFWGVAGLRCAAELLRVRNPELAESCAREADEFLATIMRSVPQGEHRRFPEAIPASPLRRMDSGAVGSLVADYPLQLFAPGESRIMKTADFLEQHSLHGGGFFQNMIHSGINAYLTLHLAQVRLRAGDADTAWRLMDAVAELASPTGQWPEAIHPRTRGGCMGDGQHIWAAAEWVAMIRACFLREELTRLVIGPGVRPQWWAAGNPVSFGPALTRWGAVTVTLRGGGGVLTGCVEARWRGAPPALELAIPGMVPVTLESPEARTEFQLNSRA